MPGKNPLSVWCGVGLRQQPSWAVVTRACPWVPAAWLAELEGRPEAPVQRQGGLIHLREPSTEDQKVRMGLAGNKELP